MSIPAPRVASPSPKEVLERRNELAVFIHNAIKEESGIDYETVDEMDRQDPSWSRDVAELLLIGGWVNFPVKIDPNAPHYRTPPPGDSGVSRPRGHVSIPPAPIVLS